MLLTCGVSNIFNIWHMRKKFMHMGKIGHVLHISRHFSTLNSWYFHYKYMLSFQWRLFCKLKFGSHFSIFCISNLMWTSSSHDLLLLFQWCFGAQWHFYKFFTCHCDLILCKSKIYHFNSLYVDYHNLNVRCIKTNIFYNGFCRHGGEVALVWTCPSSWTTCIKKCSSNTIRWAF